MYTTLTPVDILFAVVLLFYGILYTVKPPKFRGSNALNTRYTRKSPDAWSYGHKVGGRLFLGSGLLLAALCILKRFLIGTTCSAFIRHGYTILEVVLVLGSIILTDSLVRRKFGFDD